MGPGGDGIVLPPLLSVLDKLRVAVGDPRRYASIATDSQTALVVLEEPKTLRKRLKRMGLRRAK